MRRIGYQNAVLTLIAAFLGFSLIERAAVPALTEPSRAAAQPADPDQGGLANALEQRKQIIAELRVMNSRLDRIEAKLAGGLSGKVTERPAIRMTEDKPGEGQGRQAKPGSRIDVKQGEANKWGRAPGGRGSPTCVPNRSVAEPTRSLSC